MTSKQVLGIGLTLLAGGLGALALRAMVAPTNAGPKANVAPVDLPYSKPAKAVLPYSPSP